jgi:hypothetical protein
MSDDATRDVPNDGQPNGGTPNRGQSKSGQPSSGGPKPRRRGGRRRGRGNARNKPRAAATAPAPRRAQEETTDTDDEVRALSDSLRDAVLRHTTAAVLGRGRGYAKRNRVSGLRIGGGRVRARVQGSGAQRYLVELTTPTQPPPTVVRRIRWSCNCPYAAEHRRGTCRARHPRRPAARGVHGRTRFCRRRAHTRDVNCARAVRRSCAVTLSRCPRTRGRP